MTPLAAAYRRLQQALAECAAGMQHGELDAAELDRQAALLQSLSGELRGLTLPAGLSPDEARTLAESAGSCLQALQGCTALLQQARAHVVERQRGSRQRQRLSLPGAERGGRFIDERS